MISFTQIERNIVAVEIDIGLFNDVVITKSLYWLSNNYNIFQKTNGKIRTINLEKKRGNIDNSEIIRLKSMINQNLIDFKTRDLVNQETKNIREILLIKAFANNDDFEDYNLLANE